MTSWGISVSYGPTRVRLTAWLPLDRWHHFAWLALAPRDTSITRHLFTGQAGRRRG